MKDKHEYNDKAKIMYDPLCREEGKKFLKQILHKSVSITDNKDKYDVDLVLERKNGLTVFFEVEYKEDTKSSSLGKKKERPKEELEKEKEKKEFYPLLYRDGIRISKRKQSLYNGDRYVLHITFLDEELDEKGNPISLKKCVLFSRKQLKNAKIKPVKITYRGAKEAHEEDFMFLNMNETLHYEKKNGRWKQIEKFK